jgi:uncharacterized membrane protein YsdA (DUF1294 family)/cold shock CspA family protein
MRIKGTLKSWNDDRGFGFIAPIQGDQEIFVHIKAFGPRRSRPQVNEVLWFEVEVGPQGKKRAKNVDVVRRSARSEPPAQSGSVSLVAIPGFVLLYVVVGILWQPPLVLLAIYVGVSAATFFTYAKDKSASQQGAWRTPEATLHLLSFAGGWPGALIAQQILRHKSAKSEFRIVFWATVILNVIGFVILCSPLSQQLWAPPQ